MEQSQQPRKRTYLCVYYVTKIIIQWVKETFENFTEAVGYFNIKVKDF